MIRSFPRKRESRATSAGVRDPGSPLSRGRAGLMSMGEPALSENSRAGEAGSTSLFVTAQDGLRLHVRAWGTRGGRALPIVCLPGLTRNGADFEELGVALAGDAAQPRSVMAIDSRGRGGSDYDPDPNNYAFQVEL